MVLFVLMHSFNVFLQVVLVGRDVVTQFAFLIPDHEVNGLLVSQETLPLGSPVVATVTGEESLAVHSSQGALVVLSLVPVQEPDVCCCEVAIGAFDHFCGVMIVLHVVVEAISIPGDKVTQFAHDVLDIVMDDLEVLPQQDSARCSVVALVAGVILDLGMNFFDVFLQ